MKTFSKKHYHHTRNAYYLAFSIIEVKTSKEKNLFSPLQPTKQIFLAKIPPPSLVSLLDFASFKHTNRLIIKTVFIYLLCIQKKRFSFNFFIQKKVSKRL